MSTVATTPPAGTVVVVVLVVVVQVVVVVVLVVVLVVVVVVLVVVVVVLVVVVVGARVPRVNSAPRPAATTTTWSVHGVLALVALLSVPVSSVFRGPKAIGASGESR